MTQEEPKGWVTKDGRNVSNSDSQKSVEGFAGMLVATTDMDWKEKWQTPSEKGPRFNQVSSIRRGQPAAIMTFYSGPRPDAEGNINIACDIKLTTPDKKIVIDSKDVAIGGGRLHGNALNLRLSPAVIDFMGDATDPPGVWLFEITLTDKIRNVTIPLSLRLTLTE